MALITWAETSVTVDVGDTVTVDFTYGKEYGEYFDTRITTSDTGVATITTSGQYAQFGGTATITGVSAGTATVVPGPRDTQNTPLTITVTAPADDDEFLNKRGLTHFWDNIDDLKQDKLTAGTNITIAADNTISASQPTVNNATLTIQKNGTTVNTFTANASSNATANITVPEIKKRTGATTTTDVTPLYVAGDGTTATPMALKTHGDAHTGSFAYVNINEPTSVISEAYIGGYVWDEYEEWWRKISEKKLALYSDIPTVNNATLTIQKNGANVQTFTANQSTNATANITVPTNTDILNLIYPVGSIYMSATLATASAVSAAIGGTWVAWGAGRVPVGVDASDTDFDAAEETGGEKTHTLTVTEMPNHKHNISYNVSGGTAWYEGALYLGGQLARSTATSGRVVNNMDSVGGDGAHNNLQPYITCYMYKRTA